MSYFQKVWKSDAREVIEDLIKAGKYENVQGGVNDIVAEIRSMEDGYRKAKRLCMLLKFETDRTRKYGIAVTDRTNEISDIVESGNFEDAVNNAKDAIKEIKQAEDEYYRAENSLLILKSDIARVSGKGAVVPYGTSGVEDLIAKGSYVQAVSDSDDIAAKVRHLEEGYDSATSLYGAIGDWIAYYEGLGIRLPVEDGEMKSLIDGGRYDEAIAFAGTIFEKFREYGDNFLGRLKKELERCSSAGIYVPFDAAEVEEALGNGDYEGAKRIADRLFSDIGTVENDRKRAGDLLGHLKSETARLQEKGVVVADYSGEIVSMMESGEYAKAIDRTVTLVVSVLSAENDYETAMGALDSLKADISKLREKGVVFNDDTAAIEDLIEKGQYDDARRRTGSHELQIRLAESDHDSAVSAYAAYKNEVSRAGAKGIPVDAETASMESLSSAGRYQDARLEAEALRSRVKSLAWEYELATRSYESLASEIEILKGKGVIITEDPSTVKDFISSGSYQKAKSIAESIHSRIKGTELEYQLAVMARDDLKRIADEGTVAGEVPGVSLADIDHWIGQGDYRKAKSIAEDLLFVIGE